MVLLLLTICRCDFLVIFILSAMIFRYNAIYRFRIDF